MALSSTVQSRYYRVGLFAVLLVVLVGILLGDEWGIIPSMFSTLLSGEALTAGAVIIDLGILLLVSYEDF